MRTSIVISALLSTVLALAASAEVKSTTAKVVLHETATVVPDGDGFFTLGEISDITGSTPEMRDKLDNVEVGRAPLDGYTRHLEVGDVALKLRQAGIDPVRDVKLSGAQEMVVSTLSRPQAATSAASTSGIGTKTDGTSPTQAPPPIVVKRGDIVTIIVRDGGLSITATGTAMGAGAIGDTIQVHRDGMTSDRDATIVDDHTVQLELD